MKIEKLLKSEAKRYGIVIDIRKGRTRDDRGEIVLDTTLGKQFGPELHGLVNEQGDDIVNGGLEPWGNVLKSALEDIRSNGPSIQDCPSDCPCREID